MAHPPFPILLEDNHLLAVVKPAGLPTMGVDPSRPSLFSLARQYVKDKYHKPGNVYLGVVSRLDACATGVVVLARTSKAARRLAEQFRDRAVGKLYWALVPQPPEPRAADLVDWLRKDERQRKMLICDAARSRRRRGPARVPRAASTGRAPCCWKSCCRPVASTRFACSWPRTALPILGDRQYGSRTAFAAGIALHARQLTFRPSGAQHPHRTCCPRSSYMASVRCAIVGGIATARRAVHRRPVSQQSRGRRVRYAAFAHCPDPRQDARMTPSTTYSSPSQAVRCASISRPGASCRKNRCRG